MREEDALTLTKKYVDEGVPPVEIMNAYKEALSIIGKRFEEGTYFVPELILSGEMMKAASDLIKPLMAGEAYGDEGKKIGKFLLGTVEGDIHDIGKDMVHMLMELTGSGEDLGVDVPAQRFAMNAGFPTGYHRPRQRSTTSYSP
jgi:5-methyltetrahydrofolate--homocysteine methyltransferase